MKTSEQPSEGDKTKKYYHHMNLLLVKFTRAGSNPATKALFTERIVRNHNIKVPNISTFVNLFQKQFLHEMSSVDKS